MRDAVDYVVGRAERRACCHPDDRRSARALPSGSGTRSPTPSCSSTRSAHRSLVRRAPRARRPTSGWSSSATPSSASWSPTTSTAATPTPTRAGCPSPRRASSARTPWPRWPSELELGDHAAARQGRGRVRRAREAVDPGRRPRGGHRRRLPRRRLRPRPARSCCAWSATARRAVGRPARQDYKSRLQELAAREHCTPTSRYEVNEHGPEHDKTFTPCRRRRRRRSGAGEGRSRSRPSKRRPQPRSRRCRRVARRTRRRPAALQHPSTPRANRCLSCPKSRPSAASSTARSVGKRVKTVEVTGPRRVSRTARRSSSSSGSRAPRSPASSGGACCLVLSSTPATCS